MVLLNTATEVPSLREALKQFGRLVRMIRPYWSPLLKAMGLAVLLGLVGLVTPLLTKLLIDEVYPSRNATLMHVVVAGVLTIGVASSVMGAIRNYFSMYVNAQLSTATSLMFFNHLQHLTVRFFDEHQVGEIMSRFGDVRSSLAAVNKVFQTLFVNGVYLILVPPLLFLLHWQLALVALIGLPITTTITILSGRVLRKYLKRSAEASADLSALQVEVLSHIRTFKVLALEHHVYSRAKQQTEKALRLQLTAGGAGQLFGTASSTVSALNTALFTWFGWTLILSQELSLGSYIAFSAYMGYMYRPLNQFVSLFSDFQKSAVSLGRMFEYLDCATEQHPEIAHANPEPIRHTLTGNMEVRDLSFGYSADKPVLRHLNVGFPAGTITSIVGPSGAGKSTLLRVLTGMERPDSGDVFVDRVRIGDISLPDVRRQITAVWQDFSPVKGTILENLTLGCGEVDLSVVQDAIRVCRLESLIAELPDGLDTPVAEWGATLSGGQRQRLGIAHVVVRDTPIVLLDEVTANVDLTNEAAILADLYLRLDGKTVIVVTHRLATARLADQIVVMDEGGVVGSGTHGELLNTCEIYQAMLKANIDRKETRLVRAAAH